MNSKSYSEFFSILFLLVLSFSQTYGISCEIQPGESECFFEHLEANHSTTFIYSVYRGGELDIKVELYNPKSDLLFEEFHSEDSEDGGIHEFQPEETGDYEICFDNEMSTFTSKFIYFELTKEHPTNEEEEIHVGKKVPVSTVDLDPVETSMYKIEEQMEELVRHFHYLKGREIQHRELMETTSERLAWVTIIETILLLGMSLFQIIIIHRSIDSTVSQRENLFGGGKSSR